MSASPPPARGTCGLPDPLLEIRVREIGSTEIRLQPSGAGASPAPDEPVPGGARSRVDPTASTLGTAPIVKRARVVVHVVVARHDLLLRRSRGNPRAPTMGAPRLSPSREGARRANPDPRSNHYREVLYWNTCRPPGEVGSRGSYTGCMAVQRLCLPPAMRQFGARCRPNNQGTRSPPCHCKCTASSPPSPPRGGSRFQSSSSRYR